MAYTYDDFLSYLPDQGLSESDFSAEDLAMAKQNPQAGVDLMEAKVEWKNAKTDSERAMANAKANSIRQQYGGYSGGIDGKNGNVTLTYDDSPDYSGPAVQDSYTNAEILGNYSQPYDPIPVQEGAADNPYDEYYANPYVDPYADDSYGDPSRAVPQHASSIEYRDEPAYEYQAPVKQATTPAYQYQAPVQEDIPAYQYQAPVQDVKPYMEGYEDPYEITNTPASYQAGPAPDPFSYNKAAPVYQSTGEYENKYAGQQDQMLNDITNYKDFSFDAETNPQMMAYKKQYSREGKRAMQDTMGAMAGMTGGIPSTAAVSAAQQANNNYMSQLGDRLPEVYQTEYNKYLQEFNMLQDKYGAVNQAENIDYSRYWDGEKFNYDKFLSDRDQYNLDRGQSFNEYQSGLDRYNQDRNFGYGQAIDDISYKTDANNTAYNRALNEDETVYGRGRDSVNDQNYAQEQYRLENESNYGRGRDDILDQNYAQEQYRLENETEYGRKYKTGVQNAAAEADEYNKAVDRFEMMGYADAQTAEVLGIPEGSLWKG